MNVEEMYFDSNCKRFSELKDMQPLNFEFELDDDVIDDAPILTVYSRVGGELILGQSEPITTKVFIRSSWEALLPYINQAMDSWFEMYGGSCQSNEIKKDRATMSRHWRAIDKEVGRLLYDMYGINSRVWINLYENK